MSYMSRLDDARRLLTAGEFLEAEGAYWRACREWESSRFRAPLTEKAVEPLLRWSGGLLGRDRDRPALTTFAQREQRVRADLEEVARLLSGEAAGRVAEGGQDLDADEVQGLERALTYQASSRIFRLPPSALWPVTRAYLHGCEQHGLPAELGCLPRSLTLSVNELAWLMQWTRRQIESSGPELRVLSPWLLPYLTDPAIDGTVAGEAATLASRLSLLDPLGAPRALELGRRALQLGPDPAEAPALLRLVTALASNESRLATGWISPERWRELEAQARRLGAAWPAPELVEVLRRRGAGTWATLAALAWSSETPGSLLVLRLEGASPSDAVLLEPREDPQEGTFVCAFDQAREALDTWLPADAPVICDREPPRWVQDVVGGRPRVDLAHLEAILSPEEPLPAPEAPVAPHPVFDEGDAVGASWRPLVEEARSLAPRLIALTAPVPFRSAWGRENLERLGRANVAVAATLATCVRALWPSQDPAPDPVPVTIWQEVPASVPLQWPRLGDRPWPRRREATVPDPLPAGDVVLARRPSPAQLAGAAARVAPCAVVVEDDARGEETASAVASLVDPAAVTLAPVHHRCAEPLLQLLDGWIDAAGEDRRRGADVLWLYRALCLTPEGDVARWLGDGGSAQARSDVDAVLRRSPSSCPDHCRLQRAEGCFGSQLEERRAAGLVWIEPWRSARAEAARGSTLVVDDPVHHLAGLEDQASQPWLRALSRRMAAAGRVVVWVDAPHFARAVHRELNRLLPRNRPLRLVTSPAARPLAFHACPPGYAPGSPLVKEEADALTGARLALWADRAGTCAIWTMPGDRAERWQPPQGSISALEAGALRPTVDTVLVPRLSRDGPQDPLLALLRLAAAATHALRELVVLDPRLAEGQSKLLSSASAMEELVPTGTLARPGSSILADLPGRRLPTWRSPITEARLTRIQRDLGREKLGEEDRRQLATLLGQFVPGDRLVLGGIPDGGRELLAALVSRLAAECRDAGPLGVRLVIWIGDARHEGTEDDGAKSMLLTRGRDGLEHGLVAADRGRVQRLVIGPALLADPVLERWAQRNQEILWVVFQAERGLESHPLADPAHGGILARVAQLASAAGSGVIGFVDDARGDESGWLRRVARALDAKEAARAPGPNAHRSWQWLRTLMEDPPETCGGCGADVQLSHAYQLCSHCGYALLRGRSDLEAARDAVLEGATRWLQHLGPHHPWLIVAADPGERDRLRKALGLDPKRGEMEPLLGGVGRARGPYLQDVVTAEDLWDLVPRGTDLLFTRVPPRRDLLDAVLHRLSALGWEGGTVQVLDHPLQWDEDAGTEGPGTPIRHGRVEADAVQWRVSRPEVEFRAREALAALGRGLRGRLVTDRDVLGGLGPHANPADDPHLARLHLALEVWAGVDGGSLRKASPLEQQRYLRETEIEVGRCIDELERQGIGFDDRRARVIRTDQLGLDRGWRRGALHALAWLLEEGLLGRVATEAAARTAPEITRPRPDAAWLGAARATAPGQVCDLPAAPVPEPGVPRRGLPGSPGNGNENAGWVVGIAGSGKTHRLAAQAAAAAAAERQRVLVLVPGIGGLLRWQNLRENGGIPRRVEVATVSELGLAFLRHHHELGGLPARPRVVPDAATEEGLRIREKLLRETSRRYAVEMGGVPPVDLIALRRILEGGEVWSKAAASGGEDLDAKVLMDCARAARFEAGWINDADLRQLSRQWLIEHPYVAEAWRDRYSTVLVDDVEALHPDQLAFLDRMFPAVERWTGADPLLVHPRLRPQHVSAEYASLRLPKELARAASDLLFPVHRDRATQLRTRRRERGTLSCAHVLNLEACAASLEHQRATGAWTGARVALVSGHRGDLDRLAARLRESGVPVWPAREVFRACAPGPRQLLSALLLAEGLDRLDVDTAAPLVRALLLTSPHAGAAEQATKLARRLVRWSHGAAPALQSPAEAFLEPLLDLGRRIQDVESLEHAARAVRRTHLLADLMRSDAAAGRLHAYVEAVAQRPWRAVLRSVDPRAVADPFVRGGHLWLMEIDQMTGLDFDHVVYLCTGHEPVEQHYRVLGKVRTSLTVLYSEIDPFGSSR